MNMTKHLRHTALLVLMTVSHVAWAQPRMETDQDVVNVGEVVFQQPRTVTFQMKNTGTEPLNIKTVHPSCGCTMVEWTRTPIAPGETGHIKAIYDALTLGSFQKELEVYTNASDEPVYLAMQGRVVSTVTDYDGSFPIDLGVVRLNTNEIEFDDVNRGDHPVAQLVLVNTSRSSYTPQLMHLPPYLTAKYMPERLAGGRVGRILLTLDTELLKNFGLTQTSIYLARKMGDRISADNEIAVSAVLLPDFSHLTATDIESAPHMVLSADSIDMGSIGTKSKLTQTITVTNDGQRPLEVSRLQVYGKALGVSLSDRTIQPGRSAKLKVTVHAKYLASSKSRPRVLLISNDPERPKTVIHVRASK